MRRLLTDRELLILLLFSLFALAPLFSLGYFFNAHDADHSVFFLVEFDAAIRDGVLWPRWGPDHALGYGYPLWLLYAPLAYYVAEGFHLLGMGFTAAVKATWALAFLFGGVGMYVLLRRWWGRGPAARAAALVGGLVYVYAPYHLLTIYVRAAFAEFCAMAWFPWVLLAFDDLVNASPLVPVKGDRRWIRSLVLAALAYAGLLLTHTGSILLFTPLLAAYLAFALLRRALRASHRPLDRDVQDAGNAEVTLTALGLSSPLRIAWRELWQTSLRLLGAGVLAVGLAAIFLLPMLAEQRYIVQSQWVQGSYGYRQHFVFASQLVDPFWGYGYSDDLTGPDDTMSFQLGIVGVGLALTASVVGLRRRARQRSTTAFFLVASVAILLAMMPLAQPLWDAVGPAALLQFPWRLLGLAALGLAILSAAAVGALVISASAETGDKDGEPDGAYGSSTVPVAYVLALLAVLASFAFTVPQYTAIEPIDESPASIIRFETAFPEMIGITAMSQRVPVDSPLVSQYAEGRPLEKAALIAGDGSVETLRVGGASVVARVKADGPATVLFYTYDFPGWRVTQDGQRMPHRTEPPHGLITVDVPAGEHTLILRHGTTPARTVGLLISLASLVVAMGLLWLDSRDRRTAGGKGPTESPIPAPES